MCIGGVDSKGTTMLDHMLGLQLEIAELDVRIYNLKCSDRENSDEYKDLTSLIETKKLQLENLMDSLKPSNYNT